MQTITEIDNQRLEIMASYARDHGFAAGVDYNVRSVWVDIPWFNRFDNTNGISRKWAQNGHDLRMELGY